MISTFCVVKGHFASFLVSNIYWLTSLSTDLTIVFSAIISKAQVFVTNPISGTILSVEYGIEK